MVISKRLSSTPLYVIAFLMMSISLRLAFCKFSREAEVTNLANLKTVLVDSSWGNSFGLAKAKLVIFSYNRSFGVWIMFKETISLT